METKTPLNLAAISEDEFNSEMEKSYKSMKAGKGKPAKKAFAKVKRIISSSQIAFLTIRILP